MPADHLAWLVIDAVEVIDTMPVRAPLAFPPDVRPLPPHRPRERASARARVRRERGTNPVADETGHGLGVSLSRAQLLRGERAARQRISSELPGLGDYFSYTISAACTDHEDA